MTANLFTLEVEPRIPDALARLPELADNLFYSWDRDVRALFRALDVDLWHAVGHNPRLLLRRVGQQRLHEAALNTRFLDLYRSALLRFDDYMAHGLSSEVAGILDPERDLIAYFCAEYGFHESLRIYSGGLGILAGDHCKTASDLGLPFVAVGLLYRQGYFDQGIDRHGYQEAWLHPSRFADLPLSVVRDATGEELRVSVPMERYEVQVRIWEARVGRLAAYLLDTDVAANDEIDRGITHRLYGGDQETRIRQELILGVGGVRALRALSLAPTVWHINEGHAAFSIVERVRETIDAGMTFQQGLELCAAATAFTTHTPVAAGHDVFPQQLAERYLAPLAAEMEVEPARLFELAEEPGIEGFNMTALALRGARYANGVSRVHRDVAARNESYVWPQIPTSENPLAYVTNGVHVPTFLAREWSALFDGRFSGWHTELAQPEFWAVLDEIPDHRFWSLRQDLKSELLRELRRRLVLQHRRNGLGDGTIARITRQLGADHRDVLVIGFARRFATYKRAGLIFRDPARLERLMSDPERPVLLVIAGKAHPDDGPGQELLRHVYELSMSERFIGRVLVVEDYGIALARRLVAGVDIWLNTPEYPMEASGTSGQKAAINGAVNLSMLDGWWAEGHTRENGWALRPHTHVDDPSVREGDEALDLLDVLEHQVLPMYFDHDGQGYSSAWIAVARASMRSVLPNFSSVRMVREYLDRIYLPARDHALRLTADGGAVLAELTAWKARLRAQWPAVAFQGVEASAQRVHWGDRVTIRARLALGELSPEEVVVESVMSPTPDVPLAEDERWRFEPVETNDGEAVYALEFDAADAGARYYRIRAYPFHPLLAHPFEMGMMVWA